MTCKNSHGNMLEKVEKEKSMSVVNYLTDSSREWNEKGFEYWILGQFGWYLTHSLIFGQHGYLIKYQ